MDVIREMRESGEAEKRVSESQLITIELGNMDIFIYPRNVAFGDGLDLQKLITELSKGYTNFVYGFQKLIKRIREINPTATVMLVGQFNPFGSLKFTGALGNAAVLVIGSTMANMNSYMKQWAKTYDCTYVDISGVSETFVGDKGKEVSDADIISVLGGHENHPGQEGRDLITEKIIQALPAANEVVSKPKTGVLNMNINGVNMGDLAFKKSGLGWTIRNSDGKYLCYNATVDSLFLVDNEKDATVWLYNGGFYVFAKKSFSSIFKSLKAYTKVYLSCDGTTLSQSPSKVNVTLKQAY